MSARGERLDKTPEVQCLSAVCCAVSEQTIAQRVVNNTAGTNIPNPDTPGLLSALILCYSCVSARNHNDLDYSERLEDVLKIY